MKSASIEGRRASAALFFLLCVVTLSNPLLAHPGHGDATSIPLPAWRLASEGRMFGAFFLKGDGEHVWFVDQSNQTRMMSLADLDDAGQRSVRESMARMRTLNMDPTGIHRPAEGVLAMALSAMLAEVSVEPVPQAAKSFMAFERVKTRWDESFLYVESNGLPDHAMMTGIRSWQQQVPLPQAYVGANAWRIPLKPVAAQTPAMIKGRFLRGAIALAANGVPIFNPQNNRGEISQEIGELDQWGGHCGRADDYHYHVVPLHLQNIVGKGMPLAYALDGYPIYGPTEPDGSPAEKLDECNGHTTAIGYHYHAAAKYPYVIGGFHGEVVEREGQVDPQPRANGIRPAGSPLRGATITQFKSIGKDRYQLTYEIEGGSGFVTYEMNSDGSYTFTFQDPRGQKRTQTYSRRDARAARPRDGGARGDERNNPPADAKDPLPRSSAGGAVVAAGGANEKNGSFTLTSPAVTDGGALPTEFTGDGAGATLPLQWSGAPTGTKSFALVMHHIDPEGKTKWYWILYDIPAEVTNIAKDGKGIGTLGNNSVNGKTGYAPPHSKGPGAKTYILTLYALSAAPILHLPPADVDRATLLAAMGDKILARAELKVVYDRTAVIGAADGPIQRNRDAPGVQNADAPKPDRRGGTRGEFHLLPRSASEKLKLTPDQEKELAALEAEVQIRLNKILTAEQQTQLQQMRPPRRDEQPGKGRDGNENRP